MEPRTVNVLHRPDLFDGREAGRCAIGGDNILMFYVEDVRHLAHELVHACQWQCRCDDEDVYFLNAGSSAYREDEAYAMAPVWAERWGARLRELLSDLVEQSSIVIPLDKLIPYYLRDREACL